MLANIVGKLINQLAEVTIEQVEVINLTFDLYLKPLASSTDKHVTLFSITAVVLILL